MRKCLFPVVLAIPLTLAACGQEDEPVATPTPTAVETTSEAPSGPVEVELGETINLTQDANGARDIDLTINDITVSDQCHTGLNGHTDEPEEDGYYVRMTGEMNVKQSQTNFNFSELALTALDSDGYTIEVTPAFACNHPYEDMDGYQWFEDPIDQGQKARGALEFWVADTPEKIAYSEPYEPDSWFWKAPDPKASGSGAEDAQRGTTEDDPSVAEPQAALDESPLQNEGYYSSPDNPALAEYYAEQERLANIPYADGGTCPAYKCGYGTNSQGERNPSSGEIQTLHGCQDGYINDPELCSAVEWVESHEY